MHDITYDWQCLACASDNAAEATACAQCGCPARATASEIQRFRPGHAQAVEAHRRHLAAGKVAAAAALAASRYRYLYWASVASFVFSLVVANFSGLVMLAFGWMFLDHSVAWIANPFLILAFSTGRPGGDPGAWRWPAWTALAMMCTLPLWEFKASELPPVLAWLASAVLLVIGIELYRRAYRKALAQVQQCAGPD
ncbi:hypothetical protein C5614_22135 [Massilia phosphatilytica]|nr:hypothetical protein C5614_22135 [Massilia phosphatilytica]